MNQSAILASKYGSKAQLTERLPDFLYDTAGAMRWEMPDPAVWENQAKLYLRLSWIYSALKITGETAALQQFNVMRMIGEELEDIPNHDFEKLLRKPNPLYSRFELIVNTFTYGGINGNAYWWLNRVNRGNPNEPPKEIWPLATWRVMPVPDEQMYLKGYAYEPGPGKEPILLAPHEVVHFKSFHPLNEFIGASGMEAVATSAQTDIKSQEWSYRFYGKNNARLPGILAFKDVINNPLAWERIKDDVQQAAEMRNLLLLRGVGDKIEWLKAAATQEEMQQVAQREFTKNEIYSVFAPGLASMLDVNATEANSKAGKQTFLEFAIWTRLVSMAEKITNDLLPAYGENLLGEFDDPRQTDRALELEERKAYNVTHTIDESRQKWDNDDPIGDERGELLPAQVGQSTPAPGSEERTPPQLLPFTGQEPPDEPEQDNPDSGEDDPDEEGDDMKMDLSKWRRKAINALKSKGTAAVTFESAAIPPELHAEIWAGLSECKSTTDIRVVFDKAFKRQAQDGGALLAELKRANELLERLYSED